MQKMTIQELNQLFEDAKTADREVQAEMRSNVLLIEGTHYSKTIDRTANQRGVKSTNDQKLKITKNWIHRAQALYVNSILSQAPGITARPNNDYELQHKKSAELNQSVIEYFKKKYKLKAKHREWCSDFSGIGECCVKIFFDPRKGKLRGYEGQVNETGEPLMDEQGAPLADEAKPVMSGEFVFKRWFGHQIFRHPAATSMEDSPFIGYEELVSIKELKDKYKDDPEKLKALTKSNESFFIFDSNKGMYGKERDMVSVREYYYKPCVEYPEGYFFLTTRDAILEEGPLPYGIYPVIWKGFDEHPTKARATAMVRVAKPWQIEINRASSQAALAQITTGDDKILTQAGLSIEQGAALPGVRQIKYSGTPPTILPGRVGDQFYDYIDRNEGEMSRALFLDLLDNDKMNNLDPYAMIFRNMIQNQKFSMYATKFGEFLLDVYETMLELAKQYLDDDEYIAAVGKSELINIAEFRDTSPLYHKLTLEEQEDTAETKLGRHLTLTNIMQYIGNQLSPEDIGMVMENAPFGNWKGAFANLTANSRACRNDFLAMERGEAPQISPNDDSDYMLKKVAERKKERDFNLLPPEVQDLYSQYEQFHENKKAQEMQAQKAAESEFIPTGGAMVTCEMYLPQSDPTKAAKRVRVPYQSLDWLLKMLESQGMAQDKMDQMNQAQQAEVIQMLLQSGPPTQQALQQGVPAA